MANDDLMIGVIQLYMVLYYPNPSKSIQIQYIPYIPYIQYIKYIQYIQYDLGIKGSSKSEKNPYINQPVFYVTSEVRDYGLEMTFQQPGLANYRFFGGKMCQAEN